MDECSMISYRLLELMSQGLRHALDNNRLYGNCAVLFFGDFGQLGPVIRRGPVPYLWKAPTDDYLALDRYDLTSPMRQQDDHQFDLFLTLLGRYDGNDLHQRRIFNTFLRQRHWDNTHDQPTDFFHLFSHVENARKVNNRQLEQLPGELFSFEAID
ncbi:hypothetical protein BGZ54_005509, partial [Gamsiella multidivaricata]